MENQVDLDMNIDDLLGDATDDNVVTDDIPQDDNTVDDHTNDDVNDYIDPVEPDDNTDDADDVADDDVDYMESYLKSFGIEDGKTIKFENDNGEIDEVDFNSLSNKEKFQILKEMSTPDLRDHEIETINYLRRNNATLQDVVEYYQNKAIQEYISKNGAPEKAYSVDDYNDDELYMADAKAKYPDMSDEELASDLEVAKENEAVFKKKVEAIRKQYKAIEDNEAAEAEKAERDRYETYKNSIQSTLDNFNEISLDYTNDKADSLTVEDSEKEKIYEYIVKQDANGYTQLYKDLNDPEKLVKFAWFINYGDESISSITKYYQKLLTEARKEKRTPSKPVTTRVPKADKKNEDDFSRLGHHSFEISGFDHLL